MLSIKFNRQGESPAQNIEDMKKNVIKEISYKGHIITLFEDDFHQEFAIIDNEELKLYDSIADAKRVIRGEQPYYEIR